MNYKGNLKRQAVYLYMHWLPCRLSTEQCQCNTSVGKSWRV